MLLGRLVERQLRPMIEKQKNNASSLYRNEILQSLKDGHASVFVGAGLSCNATCPADASKRMYTWGEIVDKAADKLGLLSDSDEKKKIRYVDSLSLMQKYEDAYGRPSLDELLMDYLYDEGKFEPHKMHIDLLRLPWNDVFTTNYDRLLERTAEDISDRKYKLVQNQADLVNSAGKPRIVKLHGSFPSNRPFIITEEDFRRYPQDHAPFVNTVQQSLLENTFILIGFSADDPNFVKWIGWIHDNLGINNSPKIYMVVHKALPMHDTKRLLAKNIEQVVLDELHPGIGIGKAHERFIDELLKDYLAWVNDRNKWKRIRT